MKISNQSFGFIVANHPEIRVKTQPINTPPPRFSGGKKVKKKA